MDSTITLMTATLSSKVEKVVFSLAARPATLARTESH
jgi:hypothetical protein